MRRLARGLRLAADRGAVVSGLDASAPLLEVARERTPQAALRTGDIQALPYDDAGFRRRHVVQRDPVRRRPGGGSGPAGQGLPAGRPGRDRSVG